MTEARILIVEDEQITALDEKNTLIGMGYEVVDTVASGEAALEKTRQLKPDCVVMDITLETEMTGIEAAWKIREKYDVPVIFVTAKGNKEIYEAATHNEITGYIIKPFNPEKLRETIEAALSGELDPPKDWQPLSQARPI